MPNQAQRDRFVDALKKLGGSAGNARLREVLGWDDRRYDAVRSRLIDDGVVTPGRGRGGSVALAGFKRHADAPVGDLLSETLFIDARKLGTLIDRVHRELTDDDIAKVADTYHAWRTEGCSYADVPGFAKAATIEDIRGHGFVLTPGRYVGAAELEDDAVPFEERFAALKAKLEEQFEESAKIERAIRSALGSLHAG